MKKIKTCVIVAFLLMPLLMPTLIQPVKALGNFWEQNWGDHFTYSGAPINISTSTVVYSEDESQWVKVALVVSIYEYTTHFGNDSVNFRVLLYYDSFADETMLPVVAQTVTLNVQKDLDGSNYYDQCMEVVYSGVRPGFAQGHGLDQSSYLDSTQDDREWWAVKALAYGAGLFAEGVGMVTGLISLANAWVPQEGPDYMDAGYSDYGLYSWWEDPGYAGGPSPVRQYALNSIQWTQNYGVNPSKFYGIKVWARIVLHTHHNLIGPTIETAPVYLRIARSHTLSISATSGGNTDPLPGTYHYKEGMSETVTAYAYSGYVFDYWLLDGTTFYGNPITVTMDSDHTLKAYFKSSGGGGGGGCPTLFVWNGTDYFEEGLLDIHNSDGVDVIYEHTLVTTPQRENGAHLLQLTEHPQTHSYIDQVNLYAILEDGTMKRLPLIYACHSEDGNVLPQLLLSDEWKTDTLGADLNNGTSQSIDLKFASLSPNLEIIGFVFEIEGNNPWWKM